MRYNQFSGSHPANEVHSVQVYVAGNFVLFLDQLFRIPVGHDQLAIQKLGLTTREPIEAVAAQIN
jgi:hypothetical protein